MDFVRNSDKIPAHLPKRLTISFPIWGLYDTESGGKYHDFDQMMIEHKERGFNCIRLDDGAGLIHDRSGNLRGPVKVGQVFGPYDKNLRQWGVYGEPGLCDTHARIIELFEAAKRHNIYIMLTSWYYQHTLWIVKDHELNDELHAIPPMERLQAFAEFLHYILVELEERGLDSQIACAEIFNEADHLLFLRGYGDGEPLTEDDLALVRKKHEEAIEWLKERHPHIIFAYDVSNPNLDLRKAPANMQLFDFHNYFMWGQVYSQLENNESFLLENKKVSKEELRELGDGKYLPSVRWYHMCWYYTNMDPEKIQQAAEETKKYLKEHVDEIREKLHKGVAMVQKTLDEALPEALVVSGEGVTYSGGIELVWEEYSDEYWMLVKEMLEIYREMGLWGSAVRTCCGPEDPCWTLCPKKLLEMNRTFLGEDCEA